MKHSDWPIWAIIAEAVDILALLAYIVLQVLYGLLYQVAIYKVLLNLAVLVVIYVAFTLLALHPELLYSQLPTDQVPGRVRVLTLRMLRIIKLVFILGLLVPCIFDVLAIKLSNIYNACLILLLIAIAVYYEVRILLTLRDLK